MPRLKKRLENLTVARRPKDDTRSVHDKALSLLARREHSARELGNKLAQRGHARDEAAAVIGRLQDQNLQSDVRFAGNLARRRSAQGYGPHRIAAELKSHGLLDAIIRTALAEVEVNWAALATSQLHRRFGSKPLADHAERAKRAQFLLRRGFDAATVRAVTRVEADSPAQGLD